LEPCPAGPGLSGDNQAQSGIRQGHDPPDLGDIVGDLDEGGLIVELFDRGTDGAARQPKIGAVDQHRADVQEFGTMILD
jgi:hypothetical protein